MSKTVFTAIVGRPNVGKSTLLNRLVGAKIAITSPKPQTTRNRIMGVLTEGEVQYVFIDTPGYHIPKTKLGEHMLKSVRDSVDEIDVALFVVYPKDAFDDNEKALLRELFRAGTPVILIMNKSDTLPNAIKGEENLAMLMKEDAFSDGMLVSARTGENLDLLKRTIEQYAEEGPFFFEEDTLTDQPEKVIVAEIIREKLLHNLSDELPHGTAVSIESFKERPSGGVVNIDATILSEKQSHKGMIIGKEGKMLKKIVYEARRDIEAFLGMRVNLKCWVKVREDWRNKENIMLDFGIL